MSKVRTVALLGGLGKGGPASRGAARGAIFVRLHRFYGSPEQEEIFEYLFIKHTNQA